MRKTAHLWPLLAAFLLPQVSAADPPVWKDGDLPDAVLITWQQGLDRTVLSAEAQRLGLDRGSSELKLHQALHASVGATLKRSTPLIALDQVQLAPGGGGAAVDAAIAAYLASPLVSVAEPDPPLGLAAVCPISENLYQSGRQWYLTSTAWPQARQVWCDGDLALAGQVTVAVLDTGIDAHPDFGAQLVAGASFVVGEPDTDDRNGHGTFCAGLIGATPNNGSGIAGAFFEPAKLRLMPVKVLDQCGTGSMGDLAAGIIWATAQGARVISMSIEGPGGAVALENAIRQARLQDVLLVAATGNSGSTTAYPAAYSAVLAVGALDHLNARAAYSNYGKVDLSAPGGDNAAYCPCLAAPVGCTWEVWSLATQHPACTDPDLPNADCALANGVEAGAGTSFAAPLVAAAAAMLFSQAPSRHVEEVIQRLLQGALPTAEGSGWNSRTGWGKLSFAGSLALQGPSGPGSTLKAWNWPNPFSPDREGFTTLTFMLPAQAPATLRLFDPAGDLVKRWDLDEGRTFAGMNLLTWDGRNGLGNTVANGGYLLVLESGGSRTVNRVAVLR